MVFSSPMHVIMNKDHVVIRKLVEQTLEVANDPIQDRRRKLWADFNSLRTKEVPIYILDPQGMWNEACPPLECEDPFLRGYENWLRLQLYHASFGDDFVTEKYITMPPVMTGEKPYWQLWGIPYTSNRIAKTKAYHFTEYERTLDDVENLIIPAASIDKAKTDENMEKLIEATGGIIPIHLDCYPQFIYGLSFMIAMFFGCTNMLYQFYDDPDCVHAVGKKISAAVMALFKQAENDGWFNSVNRTYGGNVEIQAPAYNHEIANPDVPEVVPMKRHWIYDCAQEFESVSAQMFDEFLISYMKPIYEQFGLLSYGCCENLTEKLPCLMGISNLRRVAVTPWADAEKCASILQDKYVISWRPNPAEMVSNSFDEENIAKTIKQARDIFRRYDCSWEINLKDFITVQNDVSRLENWAKIVRHALDS